MAEQLPALWPPPPRVAGLPEQGMLGREISYSKQNIVLYETIKKVPEGSPKYILYFTLNPCFDLTL